MTARGRRHPAGRSRERQCTDPGLKGCEVLEPHWMLLGTWSEASVQDIGDGLPGAKTFHGGNVCLGDVFNRPGFI